MGNPHGLCLCNPGTSLSHGQISGILKLVCEDFSTACVGSERRVGEAIREAEGRRYINHMLFAILRSNTLLAWRPGQLGMMRSCVHVGRLQCFFLAIVDPFLLLVSTSFYG